MPAVSRPVWAVVFSLAVVVTTAGAIIRLSLDPPRVRPPLGGGHTAVAPTPTVEVAPPPRPVIRRELPWQVVKRLDPSVADTAKRFWAAANQREWERAEELAGELCCLTAELGDEHFLFREWQTRQEEVISVRSLTDAKRTPSLSLQPQLGMDANIGLAAATRSLPGSYAEGMWLLVIGKKLAEAGASRKALDHYRRAALVGVKRLGSDHPFTGKAWELASALARDLRENPAEAERFARQSLVAAAVGVGNQPEIALSRYALYLSILQEYPGVCKDAVASWGEVIRDLEDQFGTDQPCFVAVYAAAGMTALLDRQLVSATVWLEQACRLCPTATVWDEILAATYLTQLAEVQDRVGRFDAAELRWEEAECRLVALVPRNSVESNARETALLNAKGSRAQVARAVGRSAEADSRFRTLLADPACAGEFRQATLVGFAENANSRGAAKDAVDAVEEALALLGSNPAPATRARLHALRGDAYLDAGRPIDAAADFRLAQGFFIEAGQEDGTSATLARVRLAEAFYLAGEPDAAEREATVGLDRLGVLLGMDAWQTGAPLLTLARLRHDKGDWEGALDYFELADRRTRTALGSHHPHAVASRLELITQLSALHRTAESIKLLRELEFEVKTNQSVPKSVISAFHHLRAKLCDDSSGSGVEDFELALKAAREAGNPRETTICRLEFIQHLLRLVATKGGDLQARRRYLLRAGELLDDSSDDRIARSPLATNFERVLRARFERLQGNKTRAEQALRVITSAESEDTLRTFPRLALVVHREFASLACESADWEKAAGHLRTAEEVVRSARQGQQSRPLGFDITWPTDTSLDLAAVLVESGRPKEAFESLERGLARDLLELMGNGNTKTALAPLTTAQLQEHLADDQAVVGWLAVTFGKRWYGYVLRRTGPPRWVSVSSDIQLGDDLLERVLIGAAVPGKADDLDSLRSNARKAWFDPLAPHLKATDTLPAVRRLVVVQPGPLSGLPFDLFADGHIVTYTPSASVFARGAITPRFQADRQLRVVAVGDADYPVQVPQDVPSATRVDFRAGAHSPSLAPHRLSWAKHQLAALSADRRFVGADCRRDRLEAELAPGGCLRTADLVYVAIHARADFRHPFETALLLTPTNGKGYDAFSARAMAGRRVSGVWFLAGCSTGCGLDSPTAGQQGFVQILLAGGASGVVVSLWDVDDLATALLAHRFHENLLMRRSPGPASALAEAKEWLRGLTYSQVARLSDRLRRSGAGKFSCEPGPTGNVDERPYREPRYWAAFVYVGRED